MLLANNLALSMEDYGGPQVIEPIDPSSYILGQIQENIKQGTSLYFESFYDNFVDAVHHYGWQDVNLTRALLLGDKRIVAFELLTHALSALDTFSQESPYILNGFKNYITHQLARELGSHIYSLTRERKQEAVTPQQELVIVHTLLQMGKHEAQRNPWGVKTPLQWADEFNIEDRYSKLGFSARSEIFFCTLIAYVAQEKEKTPEDKNVEKRAIKEVYDAYAFDPEAREDDLERLRDTLRELQRYSVVLLIDSHIIRGEVVKALVERGERAALVELTKCFSWREIPYNILSRLWNLQELKERKISFRFDHSMYPPGALLLYKAPTNTDAVTKVFEANDLVLLIGSFLDIESLINMGEIAKATWDVFQKDPSHKLIRLVRRTDFTKITKHIDNYLLEPIFKLLCPHDLAYVRANIAEFSATKSIFAGIEEFLEKKPDKDNRIRNLYLSSANLGSQQAVERLNRAAYKKELGFNAATGMAYLKERAEMKDQHAQGLLNTRAHRNLNFRDPETRADFERRAAEGDQHAQKLLYSAACLGELGFKAETGKRYLEEHVKRDPEAQNYLNKAAYQERLGFNAVTGKKYLEDRIVIGDQNAQEWFNMAAYNGKLGFTAETGREYLEARVVVKDQHARRFLNKAINEGRLGFMAPAWRACFENGFKHSSLFSSKHYQIKSLKLGDEVRNFTPGTLGEAVLQQLSPLLNTYRYLIRIVTKK